MENSRTTVFKGICFKYAVRLNYAGDFSVGDTCTIFGSVFTIECTKRVDVFVTDLPFYDLHGEKYILCNIFYDSMCI